MTSTDGQVIAAPPLHRRAGPSWSVGRAVAWVALLTIVVVTLAVAALGHRGEPTNSERALDLASQFACPVCEGQSVADSNSVAAQAIRAEIRKRIDQGQTDKQITDFLIGTYSDSISLKPRRSGVTALVWALPVIAFVTAFAGLTVVFLRWRTRAAPAAVSEADRDLVERARAARSGGDG